jgi:hypothetical protein
MADFKKPDPKKNQTNEIFISDFSEDVPGVTQLLSPNLASLRKKSAPVEEEKPAVQEKEKTVAVALENSPLAPEPTRATMTAFRKENTTVKPSAEAKVPVSPARSLQDFGIEFHLVFSEENGVLRFQNAQETGGSAFPAWRKSFFKGMKIDLRILGITVSFQEFSADRFPFQKEAFGLAADEFVQCVRDPKERSRMHVLFSKKSLLAKKNEIEEALASNPGSGNGGGREDSGEIKIELAS